MDYDDWSDPDLGRAFDLLDNVVGRLHPESDEYATAKRIRGMIEQLDMDLEK
jgi:hypothetical protein